MANYYTFKLTAGVAIQAPVRGRLILVDDIGAASGLDITPMLNNEERRTMPARKKAFKCWTDYDALILRADVDTTVALFLSDSDVTLGFADGAAVAVSGEVTVGGGSINVPGGNITVDNTAANRIPVEIGGSTVNVTADNVGINNNDSAAVPVRAQALTTIQSQPATVINTGAAQALPSDATWRRLHITNASDGAVVALGPAGVTFANAAIYLQPGDSWIEDSAAGAAWFATSDVNGADVRVMGVK